MHIFPQKGFLQKSPPRVFVPLLLLCWSVYCWVPAASASQRIENFVLLDHNGKAQELYYQSDALALVLISHRNDCPQASRTVAGLAELEQNFPQVQFWLIDAEDDRAAIRAGLAASQLRAPILEDNARIISESLGFDRIGELVVLDPSTWAVVYRGAVAGTGPVLAAMQANLSIPESIPESTPGSTPGSRSAAADVTSSCKINYAAREQNQRQISYSDTIAPMLKENCAYCHVDGGIGPWHMSSYEMVRGFAPMIREVVRTKRMPPWHADPDIGHWQGDRALTASQVQTLVHWIEAGTPRGDGPDPLQDIEPLASAWPLGEPDLIVTIPGFEVPANGVVDYQFPTVKNTLEHGVWITAATLLPGDRRVVHHVLAGSVEGPAPPTDENSVMDNYIIGYAPGAESYVMPEGTGVYLAPGGHFTFQLHYTPIGKVVVDNSRMGLYLTQEPPENFLRQSVVISPNLNIPANTADHEEAAYYQFQDDVLIHTLFPHSHYRGKASTFEVQYPDGTLTTVLSVPNYDFNWQRSYNPVEPIALPAGSRLIHRTIYDNSAKNSSNPDPQQIIHWGLQSDQEMLYGAFSYSWVNETTAHPIHDKARSNYTQLVGFLDKNMDGKVTWREMPDGMKKRLIQGFKMVDLNGDGGLDVDEFMAVQKQAVQRQTGPTGD